MDGNKCLGQLAIPLSRLPPAFWGGNKADVLDGFGELCPPSVLLRHDGPQHSSKGAGATYESESQHDGFRSEAVGRGRAGFGGYREGDLNQLELRLDEAHVSRQRRVGDAGESNTKETTEAEEAWQCRMAWSLRGVPSNGLPCAVACIASPGETVIDAVGVDEPYMLALIGNVLHAIV